MHGRFRGGTGQLSSKPDFMRGRWQSRILTRSCLLKVTVGSLNLGLDPTNPSRNTDKLVCQTIKNTRRFLAP